MVENRRFLSTPSAVFALFGGDYSNVTLRFGRTPTCVVDRATRKVALAQATDLKAVALDGLHVDVFGTKRVSDVDEQVHASPAVVVVAKHRLADLLASAGRRRTAVGARAAQRLLGTAQCRRLGVRFHQKDAVRT